MRIPKEQAKKPGQAIQCVLFEDERYQSRIFCTSLSGPAHKIISHYGKGAYPENLLGKAKREWIDAIPSAKFKTNYVYLNFHVGL